MSRCISNDNKCDYSAICSSNGRFDHARCVCECINKNFQPPCCEECLNGYWGEFCTFRTFYAVDEHSIQKLPAYYLTFIIIILSSVILLLLTVSAIRIRTSRKSKSMPIANDQEVRVIEQRERSSCSLPPPYTVIDLVPPPQYAQFERDHEKERCFVAKQEGNQASFLHTSTEQTCESVPMRNAVFNDPEYFV